MSVHPCVDSDNVAVEIGKRPNYTAGLYQKGKIDDVRIYNYALSAKQIKTLFNGSAAVRFGPLTGTP